MSSLNGTKERRVAQCVGDPPVSMAVVSTAFPVQRNPRTPTRTSRIETLSVDAERRDAERQLLFGASVFGVSVFGVSVVGVSAAAACFAPHGIAWAKHLL